jgi:hypothetical protein
MLQVYSEKRERKILFITVLSAPEILDFVWNPNFGSFINEENILRWLNFAMKFEGNFYSNASSKVNVLVRLNLLFANNGNYFCIFM